MIGQWKINPQNSSSNSHKDESEDKDGKGIGEELRRITKEAMTLDRGEVSQSI